jgi:hypothetical protein
MLGRAAVLSATQSAQAQLKSRSHVDESLAPSRTRRAHHSDNNGRFVLTNLSAFCHAQLGEGGPFFFADRPCVMSAVPPKADIAGRQLNVR